MSVPAERDVFDQVKRDLDARNALGWRAHGRPLDALNKPDWLQDAYEEALDLAVYLKAQLLLRQTTGS